MLHFLIIFNSTLDSEGVKELMSRVRKVVSTMPRQSDLELFTVGARSIDSNDLEVTHSANTNRRKKIELALKKKRMKNSKYFLTRTFLDNLESWGRR